MFDDDAKLPFDAGVHFFVRTDARPIERDHDPIRLPLVEPPRDRYGARGHQRKQRDEPDPFHPPI